MQNFPIRYASVDHQVSFMAHAKKRYFLQIMRQITTMHIWMQAFLQVSRKYNKMKKKKKIYKKGRKKFLQLSMHKKVSRYEVLLM